MKDRKKALNELSQAEKLKPSFDHQFMIFRQRKIIEDELTEGQEHGGIDFIAALNFENQFKVFRQLIEKSSLLHQEFWNHLLEESPDLVRLSQQGAKINASIMSVDDHWKKLSKMSTNTPKALKLYASYLIEILNDKETGNEQMLKAKEAANLRVNFEFNGMNEDYSDVNNYAQDGTPCIYISGESERLGFVNQCNMSLCKVFGYNKKDEIVNKNVEMLMPRIYSEHHREFLTISMQKSADQISSRERQVFGKHISGYIFPLWLQIKNLPSLLSGRQYVATFKVEKTGINKNVAHLILNRNKEIMDVSPSCIQMLGITYEKLYKKNIYYDIPSILPQLFQHNSQMYQNKAGSQIVFHFPILQEVEQQKKQEINQDDDQYEDKEGVEGQTNLQENESQIDNTSQIDFMGNDQDFPNSPLRKGKTKLSKKDQDNRDEEAEQTVVVYQFKAVGLADKSVTFQCNLTEIFFDLVGIQGGYHLRLESISDKHQNAAQNLQKAVKQKCFQFNFDPIQKHFVRELRDGENKDYFIDKNYLHLKGLRDHYKNLMLNASEEQNNDQVNNKAAKLANISYMQYIMRQQKAIERGLQNSKNEDEDDNLSDENSSSPSVTQKKETQKEEKTSKPTWTTPQPVQVEYSKQLVALEGSGKDFLKGEIERLIKLLQEKQQVGQGVHTFSRLEPPKKGWEETHSKFGGLFSDKAAEIQKVEEEEEQNELKSGDKDKDNEQLKANIKSKKAFSMAINDKTMPPPIKRLSRTAQVIVAVIIALAISEYAIIFKQFTDTKNNFSLIQLSYQRIAELQKVAYNARTMVLLNQGFQTNTMGFASISAYVLAIKSSLASSLNTIYSIQNEINLSQLPVSGEQDQLLNNKTVNLYFLQDANQMKALQFSLTESILQISSTIFTVSNLDLKSFNETNEDVFFLLYNSFNDFYQALTLSSQLYVQELYDRASQKSEISMVLYILAVLTITTSLFILIPVVISVNQQKDKVLTLFCEIDNSWIRVLSLRCEKFINNMQSEEGNEDIDSNEDMETALQAEDDSEYSLLSGTGKRVKKAKGKSKTDKTLFLKFMGAMQILHAYFIAVYLMEKSAVNTTQILGNEVNITASADPYDWFALNVQREMIYNKNRVVENENSFVVARDSIDELYKLNNDMQQSYLRNKGTINSGYWNDFEVAMRNDTCSQQTYFNKTSDCEAFISGILTQGLHATMIKYFDTLRSTLSLYETDMQKNNQTAIYALFNSVEMQQLYIMQNNIISVIMNNLVNTLASSIQTEYSLFLERKIAIFICFLIVVLIAFFLFWLPFLNNLNQQIYKTKLMLMIIPLEILMKIKNVTKVLQSQNFLGTNNNNNNMNKTQGKNKKKQNRNMEME